MKRICFFLSDHGFGHIARNIPIIVSVIKNYDTFVYVVCGERHIEFAKKNLETMLTAEQYGRTEFCADHTDIGLICKDGTLDVDTDALTKACMLVISHGQSYTESSCLKRSGRLMHSTITK